MLLLLFFLIFYLFIFFSFCRPIKYSKHGTLDPVSCGCGKAGKEKKKYLQSDEQKKSGKEKTNKYTLEVEKTNKLTKTKSRRAYLIFLINLLGCLYRRTLYSSPGVVGS